jgi:sugar lactone lactonase YvrE
MPVSNGDEQNSTGFAAGNWPGGVDITKDGKYAVFGDIPTVNGFTTVEVSNISSGKLTATNVYGSDGSLGSATNSNNVLLSPDESVVYISNNSSGQVTAAFFNTSTGAVTNGCVSPTLRKYFGTWFYTSGLSNGGTTGTGGNLYVAEWGGGLSSSIGVLGLTKSGGSCTLMETGYSPITDANSIGLLTVGAYPPRPF